MDFFLLFIQFLRLPSYRLTILQKKTTGTTMNMNTHQEYRITTCNSIISSRILFNSNHTPW